MVVLSYGFQNPVNGDKGSVWFPALNFNIIQLNNHIHDGITSALINSAVLVGGLVTALAASWVTVLANAKYSQLLTVPAGFTMGSFSISVFLNSTGHMVQATVEKVSSTTFTIYTNDNTQQYNVVFR